MPSKSRSVWSLIMIGCCYFCVFIQAVLKGFLACSTLTIMYDTSKNSEKWVDSKYVKIERLGILVCMWSLKILECIFSTSLFHDILYTVRFVKMRVIQQYYFNYVNSVGKRPLQQNTVFFWFGTMLMMLWLCNHRFYFKEMKLWI